METRRAWGIGIGAAVGGAALVEILALGAGIGAALGAFLGGALSIRRRDDAG